jgi:hypothetical protein
MRRKIWNLIIDTDDWIIEAVLDDLVAVLLAAAATGCLQFLFVFAST